MGFREEVSVCMHVRSYECVHPRYSYLAQTEYTVCMHVCMYKVFPISFYLGPLFRVLDLY